MENLPAFIGPPISVFSSHPLCRFVNVISTSLIKIRRALREHGTRLRRGLPPLEA
jgi:hypothetical protein